MRAVTRKRLKELLRYNEATGAFYWNVPRPGLRKGTRAGGNKDGYTVIRLDWVLYRAALLAWFYVTGRWPKNDIDHRNGKRSDDRFSNLRDVTRSVNLQNQRVAKSNNKVGVLGVAGHKGKGKYRAAIRVGGKQMHLGLFDTVSAAEKAYLKAKQAYHTGTHV